MKYWAAVCATLVILLALSVALFARKVGPLFGVFGIQAGASRNISIYYDQRLQSVAFVFYRTDIRQKQPAAIAIGAYNAIQYPK